MRKKAKHLPQPLICALQAKESIVRIEDMRGDKYMLRGVTKITYKIGNNLTLVVGDKVAGPTRLELATSGVTGQRPVN